MRETLTTARTGLRRASVLLFGFIGGVSAIASFIGLFSAKLPVVQLAFDCDINSATPAEIDAAKADMLGFAETADGLRGQVVFLDFRLAASSHAGNCALADPPDPESAMPPAFSLRQAPNDPRLTVLSAFTPEINAGHIWIGFPVVEDIPPNGVFTTYEDYFHYAVTGPFILQSEHGNGRDGALFRPVLSSESLWREATCARASVNWPRWLRRLRPCF